MAERVAPLVVEENARNIRRRARVYRRGDVLPDAAKARNFVIVSNNELIMDAVRSIKVKPTKESPWIVEIPPGRYAEDVDLTKYPWVSLYGEGPGTTILTGKPGGGDCVISATATSSVGNLTIMPTDRYRTGLEVEVTEDPCRLVKYYELEFIASDNLERGFAAIGGEELWRMALWDNLFTGGFIEAAIAMETDVEARIERSLFRLELGHGIIAGGDRGHYIIHECEFEIKEGWAVANGGETSFRIHDCYIDRSKSGRGGISLVAGGPHTVTDTTIIGGSLGRDLDTRDAVEIAIRSSFWRPNTLPEKTSVRCENILEASIGAIALVDQTKLQVVSRRRSSAPVVARYVDVIYPFVGSPVATSPLPNKGGTPGYGLVLRNISSGQVCKTLLSEDREAGYTTIELDGEFHVNEGDEWLLFLVHADGASNYMKPGFDHRFIIYG